MITEKTGPVIEVSLKLKMHIASVQNQHNKDKTDIDHQAKLVLKLKVRHDWRDKKCDYFEYEVTEPSVHIVKNLVDDWSYKLNMPHDTRMAIREQVALILSRITSVTSYQQY